MRAQRHESRQVPQPPPRSGRSIGSGASCAWPRSLDALTSQPKPSTASREASTNLCNGQSLAPGSPITMKRGVWGSYDVQVSNVISS